MLSPEVWNFSAPQCLKQIEHGNLETNKKPIKMIQNHYFNHLVSIVLPDSGTANAKLIKDIILSDCQYYKVLNLSLEELLEDSFVEAFIKKGKFYALSIGTSIDWDDSVCIAPTGDLILSLTKDTYQTLGIEGQISFFCKKVKNRYIVKLNLKEDKLKAGAKRINRIKCCFQQNFKHLTLIFNWLPEDQSVCPSSPASFLNDLGYEVQSCDVQITERLDYTTAVPVLDNLDDCSVDEIIEWLGMFSLSCTNDDVEHAEYLTSYKYSGNCETFGQNTFLSFTGLFTPEIILKLVDELREYLATRPSLPWVSLHVQGFKDSPISWGLKEHQFYNSGDNLYTLILQQNQNFISHRVLESNKKPSSK